MGDWVKQAAEKQHREERFPIAAQAFWRTLLVAIQKDVRAIRRVFGYQIECRLDEGILRVNKSVLPGAVDLTVRLNVSHRNLGIDCWRCRGSNTPANRTQQRLVLEWGEGDSLYALHRGERLQPEAVSELLLSPITEN